MVDTQHYVAYLFHSGATGGIMETVLIDTFVVPEESRAAFLDRAHTVQRFMKPLPGFVEGFIYEQRAGTSQHNVLTIAVWEDEQAFENAKQAVASENQRQGINPQEVTKQLGIEFTRAVYARTPY